MSGRPNAEKRTERTKKLVYTAVFAAITACLAQITIPMPSGVPITLQTFAVAFARFFLGAKCGFAAVGIYILLGAAGAPVFSGFTGGAPHLIGLTGGFVWGFLPFVALAGAFSPGAKTVCRVAAGMLGALACHAVGIVQYALITGNDWGAAALAVSAPYLAKDLLSVLLAFKAADAVARRLDPASYRAARGDIDRLPVGGEGRKI